MLIFDETNTVQEISDIYTPLYSEYMWTLNCDILDFTLTPIQMLEEMQCAALRIMTPSGGTTLVPAGWTMLICDRDTAQIDTISVAEFAGKEFSAFAYGPAAASPVTVKLSVVDYIADCVMTFPCLSKTQMLCHPISGSEWICISPTDPYNKYLKDKIIGDLVSY